MNRGRTILPPAPCVERPGKTPDRVRCSLPWPPARPPQATGGCASPSPVRDAPGCPRAPGKSVPRRPGRPARHHPLRHSFAIHSCVRNWDIWIPNESLSQSRRTTNGARPRTKSGGAMRGGRTDTGTGPQRSGATLPAKESGFGDRRGNPSPAPPCNTAGRLACPPTGLRGVSGGRATPPSRGIRSGGDTASCPRWAGPPQGPPRPPSRPPRRPFRR